MNFKELYKYYGMKIKQQTITELANPKSVHKEYLAIKNIKTTAEKP